MSGDNSSTTDKLKTFGFLVAIESGQDVSKELVEQALSFYLNDTGAKLGRIDVERLGELDVYPEETDEKATSV